MKRKTAKSKRHKSEHGRGHVYEQHGAWFLQFYQTEMRDGVQVRVRKSVKLADKDREHNSATCKAVRLLRQKELTKVSVAPAATAEDMKIVDFWNTRFLPYCEDVLPVTGLPRLKPTTVRGYKQIWRQHLLKHFGAFTLQQYTPDMGDQLLDSLTATQNENTLRHIKALGSAIFKRAKKAKIITVNPWSAVSIPEDAVKAKTTRHYTMEEAEDMVTVLVDHVDAQLVIALACFLGLGPAEIAGLQWGDIDQELIHIRRNKPAHGEVGTPKTAERAASIPLIDRVRVPLELWRAKCRVSGQRSEAIPAEAWVIADLPNLINRVIKPHVMGLVECDRCEKKPKPSGVKWAGLYAGRRGACTAVIEATGGNYAVAQALLRHKHMTTTLNVYKKQITPAGFKDGMNQFQKSLK